MPDAGGDIVILSTLKSFLKMELRALAGRSDCKLPSSRSTSSSSIRQYRFAFLSGSSNIKSHISAAFLFLFSSFTGVISPPR